MQTSQATVNPAMGSINVTLGSDDEGSDLETSHLIAPWPNDEHCEEIAIQALTGMGWKAVGGGKFTGDRTDPEATFVVHVTPAARPATA